MHDDPTDARIDDAVRRASARPVDEAVLTRNVLSRIRAAARPATSPWAQVFALPDFHGFARLAPAGFALVLVATPYAVATYPGDATDRAIYAMTLGDPALIASTDSSLFSMDLFE